MRWLRTAGRGATVIGVGVWLPGMLSTSGFRFQFQFQRRRAAGGALFLCIWEYGLVHSLCGRALMESALVGQLCIACGRWLLAVLCRPAQVLALALSSEYCYYC